MISRRKYLLGSSAVLGLAACSPRSKNTASSIITIDIFDADFEKYVSPKQDAEILSAGHQWLEGPTWDTKRQCLYFTDVPQNTAYSWNKDKGIQVFRKPSGADVGASDGFREPGANGLLYQDDDTLLICNHGKRAVEKLDLNSGNSTILCDQYLGKKFNSPNDISKALSGDLFFTDPPYGLIDLDASPLKEMDANGVYCLTPAGEVKRLLDDMTFPNGIAVAPDQKHIFISQSDPSNPIVRRIELDEAHNVIRDEVWFDATSYQSDTAPGLPDGMAMVSDGALFVTGPDGVFLLSPTGTPLGRINTRKATANCTFGENGSTLFITAGNTLLKFSTLCHG